MATRSNIAIKVLPKDYKKVSFIINTEVSDETPYIQIYSHNDGFPEHMLYELETYFNTYEKALELVLEGDTSGVYDGRSEAYRYLNERYEDNLPMVLEEPSLDESYLYVFEDDKWYVEE